jgi:hypothetical protein
LLIDLAAWGATMTTMTERHFEDEQPVGLAVIDGFPVCRRLAGSPHAGSPHDCPGAGLGAGSRPAAPSRAASDVLQHSVGSLYRATVVQVCLMLLAVANITSGILIANQQYERLPAPLLLSVLLSLICALLQSTGEQRSNSRSQGHGVRQ